MSHSAPAGRQPNRLINESSPYLKQHAYNPVDWFPWGEDAFAKAKAEGKPIFLSVGYSACHWCHVMERESFEDESIAKFLNEHFVSIKVDREERPDIDQIYMSAVQLITRRGGWPMSVFLTPDGRPYYGGTYWPPTSRMGMPGFGDLLTKLHDYWTNRRDEVETSADQLLDAIQNLAAPVFDHVELGAPAIQKAMEELVQSADKKYGGFGGAPKFPHPMDLRVLLRGWRRTGNEQALKVVRQTLTMMARGGIYDQLGGGFHRYSTDGYWLVPHFEKMLYDNALLVPAYLEMFQISGDKFFARIARETLDYVLREMTSPEGGFYSTQDADSEGVEGKFFVWRPDETKAVLGADDAAVFNEVYDVSARGNWEGHSILNLPRPLEQLSVALNHEPDELQQILERCRRKLLAARSRRIAPGRDEKILTNWNGMMIAAFAQASLVLDEPEYLEAATRAADFVLSNLREGQARLKHSYKDGQARFAAYLDDYACLIDGLGELVQAGGQIRFLEAALHLTDDVIERFSDQEEGGFYYTAMDHEELIARTKDAQDNATPSGNGMMATALVKLSRLTERADLEERAVKTLNSMGSLLAESPRASGQAILALDLIVGPVAEIVVADANDGLADSFARIITTAFLPGKVLLKWAVSRSASPLLPLLEGKLDSSRTRVSFCERGVCQLPCETLEEVESAIRKLASRPE